MAFPHRDKDISDDKANKKVNQDFHAVGKRAFYYAATLNNSRLSKIAFFPPS